MTSMKWANNLSVFNGVFHNDVTSGLSHDKPSIFFQQPQKFTRLHYVKVINILLLKSEINRINQIAAKRWMVCNQAKRQSYDYATPY